MNATVSQLYTATTEQTQNAWAKAKALAAKPEVRDTAHALAVLGGGVVLIGVVYGVAAKVAVTVYHAL